MGLQSRQIVGIALPCAGQCHSYGQPIADGIACRKQFPVFQQFTLLAAQSGHSLRTLCDLFSQRRLRFRKDHRWEQKQHTKKCR